MATRSGDIPIAMCTELRTLNCLPHKNTLSGLRKRKPLSTSISSGVCRYDTQTGDWGKWPPDSSRPHPLSAQTTAVGKVRTCTGQVPGPNLDRNNECRGKSASLQKNFGVPADVGCYCLLVNTLLTVPPNTLPCLVSCT